jgi:hypothetical protein
MDQSLSIFGNAGAYHGGPTLFCLAARYLPVLPEEQAPRCAGPTRRSFTNTASKGDRRRDAADDSPVQVLVAAWRRSTISRSTRSCSSARRRRTSRRDVLRRDPTRRSHLPHMKACIIGCGSASTFSSAFSPRRTSGSLRAERW